MIQNLAIDTSLLVRLATRSPVDQAEKLIDHLDQRIRKGASLWVSSMVIGEAYIAMQHHYHLPKKEIRKLFDSFLSSGVIRPMDGNMVVEAIRSTSGPGLVDRLISIQGIQHHMKTLTLDKKMGSLESCEKIRL